MNSNGINCHSPHQSLAPVISAPFDLFKPKYKIRCGVDQRKPIHSFNHSVELRVVRQNYLHPQRPHRSGLHGKPAIANNATIILSAIVILKEQYV